MSVPKLTYTNNIQRDSLPPPSLSFALSRGSSLLITGVARCSEYSSFPSHGGGAAALRTTPHNRGAVSGPELPPRPPHGRSQSRHLLQRSTAFGADPSPLRKSRLSPAPSPAPRGRRRQDSRHQRSGGTCQQRRQRRRRRRVRSADGPGTASGAAAGDRWRRGRGRGTTRVTRHAEGRFARN